MISSKRSVFYNITVWLLACLLHSSESSSTSSSRLLDETSVVLITGAAGFLGSEVALALHRVYRPKQLILIDSLEKSNQDLNAMEFQRQRVFRILQEIEQASFYRVDLRPAIPEYYDTSEVPVLDHILAAHDPVTHIFHAARSYSETNVIPRSKGLEKAGLMESMLEQVLSWNNKNRTTVTPSFVFMSDINVLGDSSHQPELLPQTLSGAAAAIQELIAAQYYDRVPSTALRFSSIYGPWDRRSRVFELVSKTSNNNNDDDASYDLVYIDDAVDAVLTALQLPQAVGSIPIQSGYRISEEQLISYIQNPEKGIATTKPNPPERAKELLHWEPLVSLAEGLRNTLNWQADRASPYSSRQSTTCDTYDSECWNGTPIFPCASECANEYHCKSTAWDDVLSYTNAITTCDNAILYTVQLDPQATSIPSAFVRVSTQSKAFVESSTHCNIAFVAHTSPLFVNHQSNTPPQHGFWTLVPVAATEETFEILSLIPKLSPGTFFRDSVRIAIYVDPDVLIDDINALLETVSDGSTVLLTGRQTLDPVKRQRPTPPTTSITSTARERAYRMMQIAMLEHGIRLLSSELDTSIIVYGALHDPNVRLLRCDVLSEIVQWKPNVGDASSLAFMLSLHDLWSRVEAERSGKPIDWATAKEQRRRRLEEVNEADVAIKTAFKKREGVVVNEAPIGEGHKQQEAKDETKEDREKQEFIDITVEAELPEEHVVEERPVSNDDDTVETAHVETNADGQHQHNGFGVVDAIEAVLGLKQQERTVENQDDFVVDDDDRNAATPKYQPVKHDADDDIVMGILSSPQQQLFARVASLETIGVYRVTKDVLMQQDNVAAASM